MRRGGGANYYRDPSLSGLAGSGGAGDAGDGSAPGFMGRTR